jgi:hypothetical protein
VIIWTVQRVDGGREQGHAFTEAETGTAAEAGTEAVQ